MKNNHLMIRFIFLSGFLFQVIFTIKAQQYDWLSHDFPGSYIMDIFEIDGKYYGAVSNGAKYYYDPNTIYQLTIFEIEFIHEGEPGLFLKEVITIPYPEYFGFYAVFSGCKNAKNWSLKRYLDKPIKGNRVKLVCVMRTGSSIYTFKLLDCQGFVEYNCMAQSHRKVAWSSLKLI